MKDKIVAVLVKLYGSVENALAALASKRVYALAMVAYIAVSELAWQKFVGLCAVACMYIWSETIRKQK